MPKSVLMGPNAQKCPYFPYRRRNCRFIRLSVYTAKLLYYALWKAQGHVFLIFSLFPEGLKHLFNKHSPSFCCWLYNPSHAARFSTVDVCSTVFFVPAVRKY